MGCRWAGRRWGHKASGWISGLPLIAAPIMLFLAFDQPRDFVLPTAWIAMTVAPAVGVHCLVFARLCTLSERRLPPMLAWPLCLLSGWIACVLAEFAFAAVVVPNFIGAAVAVVELLLLGTLMPRAGAASAAPSIPMGEVFVRMGAALALVTVITLGASAFGPRVSGILLGFPITASVLPVFTLVLYGADSTVRLLSGFLTGLIGFVVYFFAFASVIQAGAPPLAGFAAGVSASLASAALMALWNKLKFQQEAA